MAKKKSNLILFILTMFSLLFITVIPCYSMAGNPFDDPDFFKPKPLTEDDVKLITGKANKIIGAIVTVGVVISAVTLGILGIKYMIGSAEEKAEYKKSMIPYIIGAVLLFACSTFVSLIAKIVQNTDLAK